MSAIDKLRNAAAEAGWTEATMLLVACEFIDESAPSLMFSFQDYLDQRVTDEMENEADDDAV